MFESCLRNCDWVTTFYYGLLPSFSFQSGTKSRIKEITAALVASANNVKKCTLTPRNHPFITKKTLLFLCPYELFRLELVYIKYNLYLCTVLKYKECYM